MNTSTAIVTCPNPKCEAPNALDNHFCQKCKTYVPRRYLWTVGQQVGAESKGQLIGDRYLVVDRNILLDTKPGLIPLVVEDIPPFITSYLKLSGYQPQIPKVYGLATNSHRQESIWLLENAPIHSQGVASKSAGRLMSRLIDRWKDKDITPLRQLNWLSQIVELWQPMVMEKVASTLLTSECLRVEGSLIRILELVPDGQRLPNLGDLGRFLQQNLPYSHPALSEFWQVLCQQLAFGKYTSSEQVLEVLANAMNSCAGNYNRLYQIATYSDKGPTRSRNEDACYPSSGGFINAIPGNTPGLTIVCDGIGGHEGGNVASNMAIEVISQEIERSLVYAGSWEPKFVSHQLETYIRNANDRIAQRNDAEQRHSRQRMGTTVVMGVSQGHQVFLAHVGDSRAYRISRTGCYQVTLDDDLAAREVRLGYALYRDALQHASSGSLIQALGMGGSYNLHPSVQKFVIDEDCIFLLCSDGLSDRDRVEQYWEACALPVLEGKKDLQTLAQELLNVGNSLNGHDNVTIGLLYCQAKPSPQVERSPVPPPPEVVASPTYSRFNPETKIQLPGDSTHIQLSPIPPSTISPVVPTAVPYAPNSSSSKPGFWRWGWLIPLGLLGAIAAGAGAIWFIKNPQHAENSPSFQPDKTTGTQNSLPQPFEVYRITEEVPWKPISQGAYETIAPGNYIKVLPVQSGSDGGQIKVLACFPKATQGNTKRPQSYALALGWIERVDLQDNATRVKLEELKPECISGLD